MNNSIIFGLLLLCMAGSVLADVNWENSGGDRLWRNAANWQDSVTLTARVPGAQDKVGIRGNFATGPIIDASTTASALNMVVGDWSSTVDHVEMTGGSLAVGGWLILGYGAANNGTLTLSNGTISTIDIMSVGYNGVGTVHMTGGSITIGSTFNIARNAGSTGNVFLSGGTISAGSFSMTSGGTLDISGGTLIVNGDVSSTMNTYISNGWITAYGGAGVLNVDITSTPRTIITASLPVVHYDNNGRLVYHSDEEGNRIMDFSYAGYKNGEAALPNVAVVYTINPIAGDNTAHLQAAINTVSARPKDANGRRGTLLLGPGTYPVSQTIYLNASGVVIRGSGRGSDPAVDTIIYATGTDQRSVIIVGSNTINGWGNQVSGTQQNITSNFIPAGSRTFTVANASLYRVGDNVIIRHPSTDAWLSEVNYGNTAEDVLWLPGEIDMRFNRFITRIEGNAIEVDVPIYHQMDSSLSQPYLWVYSRSTIITESGIENLRIDIQTAGEFDNNHPEANLKFVGVEDCWAKDVTTQHFAEAGIWLNQSSRTTVLNCSAIEPHSVIEDGRRYNLYIGDYCNNILFKGCDSSKGRHTFVSNGASSVSGAVFTQCTSTTDYASSESHRRWGSAILWDKITFSNPQTGYNLGVGHNRGNYGTAHGWTGTGMVAWNVTGNHIVVQKPPIGQNFAIGCNAVVDNKGPWVFPAGYIEGTKQDLLIDSLYEAQLAERLTYGVGPDAPAKLKPFHYSFGDNSKYVSLEWVDVSLRENQYMLERSSDGGSTFEVIAVLSANSQSYTDTNILQDNYYYRLKAVNSIGASAYSNLLYVDLLTRLRPEGTTIQAEKYTAVSGCSIARSNIGYTSEGFVDMGGSGTWFEWNNINVDSDASCTLAFRYASTSNRPCAISVNGAPAGTVSFASTGSWTVWLTDTVDLRLNSGMNTIRITASTSAGGPNIDKLSVAPGAGLADFKCDGIVDLSDFSYLSGVWSTSDYRADIAQPSDGSVNVLDLLVFMEQWLRDSLIDGEAAYWKLDETTGSAASDYSNAHHGTLMNMDNSDWVAGKLGNALDFDGVDDYVDVSGYKGVTGTASRTCCAWIKTTSTQQGNILSWGAEQNGQKWTFRTEANGALGVGVWGGYINTTATINNGQWHHVAAVLNDDGSPAVNEILLYIDGILQPAGASSSQAVNTTASQDTMIGASKNAGVPSAYFPGLIDDVRIYDRALTAAEIAKVRQ